MNQFFTSKYWSFSFSISPSNEYSGLISFRIDLFRQPIFLFAKSDYCTQRKNENTLNKRRMHTGLATHTHETDPFPRKSDFSSASHSYFSPETYGRCQSTDLARDRKIYFLSLSHYDCSVTIPKTTKNFSQIISMQPYCFRTRRDLQVIPVNPII